MTLPLSIRLAAQELRRGIKGFRVFLACLILGVGAIAASGSFDASMRRAISDDAKALLGGDAEARFSFRSPTPEEMDAIKEWGEVSVALEMRAMAGNDAGERTLVEIKAVDQSYPLYGRMILEPDLSLDRTLREDGWGAAVEDGLFERLGLTPGQSFKLADARFPARARIVKEPDRATSIFSFGPRVMLDLKAAESSGLIQPGAMLSYSVLVKLRPGLAPAQFKQRMEERFLHAGWQIRTSDEAAPDIKRFLDSLTQFLTLVGLTTLLIGGIGIANGVKAFLESRTPTIAILKCLGASRRRVLSIYACEIAMLAAIGIIIGMAAGALLPLAASLVPGDFLPLQTGFRLYPEPLALAALSGTLTVVAFAAWPLSQAAKVKPGLLFRDLVAPIGARPGAGALLLIAFCAIALAVFAIYVSADKRLASFFVLGVLVAFLTFGLLGLGLERLSRFLAKRSKGRGSIAWRLALSSLHRPGAPTRNVVLSLGLGLTVLSAVGLVEANLVRQFDQRMPADAPSFFFIDIQPSQTEPFQRAVQDANARILSMAPMVRGRITALNGRPPSEVEVSRDVEWALRGDRGFTESAAPPEGSKIVSGAWWSGGYQGPPLVSLDAALMKGFGLKIGDSITVNLLGRDISATIANAREINWSTLSMNFAIVFSPGALQGAPFASIATVLAPPGQEAAVEKAISDRLPGVSSIRVKEALETLESLVKSVSLAVSAAALITLASGVLVLTGAVAAGRKRRIFEAVLMKTLGGRRRDLLSALLYEYALIGLAAGLVSAALGTVAAWGVLTFALRGADWVFMIEPLSGAILASMAVVTAIGYFGARAALLTKVAPYLRHG